MYVFYNVFFGVKNNGVKWGFFEVVGMNYIGLFGFSGVVWEGYGDLNCGEGMGMGGID